MVTLGQNVSKILKERGISTVTCRGHIKRCILNGATKISQVKVAQMKVSQRKFPKVKFSQK
jgi:hypothetical protein